MKMPEEINRILTDRISDFLYCPSNTAISNLKLEGFGNFTCDVVLSGDVMYDAVLFYRKFSAEKSNFSDLADLTKNEFVLVTLHREENTDNPNRLKALVESINEIAKQTKVIIPLHPRTVIKLKENNLSINAHIIEPQSYFTMLELLKKCRLVLTDSGGLQKEAYFFNKYCITLREETEWFELVDTGINILVGADKKKILEAFIHYNGKQVQNKQNIYGNGQAAEKIVKHLLSKIM
jgi:UDP-GlcNAc3NAcA epimerase